MTAYTLLPEAARFPDKPTSVTAISFLGLVTGWTSATSGTKSQRIRPLIRWFRRSVAGVGHNAHGVSVRSRLRTCAL